MSKGRILAVRASDGRPVAPDPYVSLSSADTGWDGIFIECQSLPPTKAPKVYMTRPAGSLLLRPTIRTW